MTKAGRKKQQGGKQSRKSKTQENYEFKQNGKEATISAIVDKRITSLDDLILFFKIDLNRWKIKTWECSSYESHTRMRRFDLQKSSKSGYYRIDDEHKAVPLYRIWAKMEENRELINLLDTKEEILKELRAAGKRYPPIKYALKSKEKGYLLEINIFDLHFGKLTWHEETGADYDIKIARELFLTCIRRLIEQSRGYRIERVVFPIGNDFFNVDGKENTTAAGTPQSEDGRWKKTFARGRELIIEAIDMLREIAPVDVVVIPGNHDVERAFYLGDAVHCWYDKCHEVNVNNSASIRKYYQYGQCLIGYTHGKDEKPAELPMIMAAEQPACWAATKYREWHLGDKHHKKEIRWMATEEFKGTTVRFMRSLTSTDAWHYANGYVQSIRAGEGFIWDKESGVVCQFSANL